MQEKPSWTEAADDKQVPFMLASRKVLQGPPVPCPACEQASLRHYFHAFDQAQQRGSLWVWCPHCRTHCSLGRVSPQHVGQIDPYAALDLDQFAELEMDQEAPWMDRLDRLWDEGQLA